MTKIIIKKLNSIKEIDQKISTKSRYDFYDFLRGRKIEILQGQSYIYDYDLLEFMNEKKPKFKQNLFEKIKRFFNLKIRI
jgi:hypothetical protein